MPDITNLATNTFLHAKINQVKNKISNITYLATATTLTAVQNKMPDHSKYISTPELISQQQEIQLQDYPKQIQEEEMILLIFQKRQILMIN